MYISCRWRSAWFLLISIKLLQGYMIRWTSCIGMVSLVMDDHTKSQRMMTSSNGNIFRATGPLCGEFTGPGDFPTHRPVTRSFDIFVDLRLNKRLSKQPSGWWFETPSWPLWRQCNDQRSKPTCIGYGQNRNTLCGAHWIYEAYVQTTKCHSSHFA